MNFLPDAVSVDVLAVSSIETESSGEGGSAIACLINKSSTGNARVEKYLCILLKNRRIY